MVEGERKYLAVIERLTVGHAAKVAVEAQLGAPDVKEKGEKCPEEWTYRLRDDRLAVLCFDESGHLVSASTGLSFDRRDF
jgi:hypothetical protein